MVRETLRVFVACVLAFNLITPHFTAYSQEAQDQEEDEIEILIIGTAQDRRSFERPGTTTVIRPTDDSRFDASSHLKLDPSLTAIDQSRSMSGGFSLPLFRGHDVRSTHVFLNDVALQDPYSGFPLIEDIDLRSFGEMRIHKGLAPWDVPVASPGGVIQFLTRAQPLVSHSSESDLSWESKVGSSFGDVQGASLWGDTRASKQSNYDVQGYVRRSANKGDYRYYNDNQTIRNSEDDTIDRRKNNESNATLIALRGKVLEGDRQLSWFAWNQLSETGLPSKAVQSTEGARMNARTSLASLSYDDVVLREYKAGVSVQYLESERRYRDPSQSLSPITQRKTMSGTSQLIGHIRRDGDMLFWFSEVRRSIYTVQQKTQPSDGLYKPHGDQVSGYLGLQIQPSQSYTLEFKADGNYQSNAEQSGNVGGSLGTILGEVSLWIQLARHERTASLLERLGDGGNILGSDTLEAEHGLFAEVGARHKSEWKSWQGERSFVFWSDRLNHRIRIEPISASQWRAKNIDYETYHGLEMRERWRLSRIELEGAVSMTKAEQENGLLIPRIPLWQAVGAAGFHMTESWTLRNTSRYNGRVFDDYANTSEIGDWWVHDLSLDRYSKDSSWSTGFSVLNYTNVKSLPIRDVETGQEDGRIAFESQTRDPLPGRQWVARVTWRL